MNHCTCYFSFGPTNFPFAQSTTVATTFKSSFLPFLKSLFNHHFLICSQLHHSIRVLELSANHYRECAVVSFDCSIFSIVLCALDGSALGPIENERCERNGTRRVKHLCSVNIIKQITFIYLDENLYGCRFALNGWRELVRIKCKSIRHRRILSERPIDVWTAQKLIENISGLNRTIVAPLSLSLLIGANE